MTARPTPSLIAPALLLPLAAVLTLSGRLPDSLATAVDVTTLLVFSAGAWLGLVTRRGRLVVGVVVLALADCALVYGGSRTVFEAIALLLPINIAVIVWLGDQNPYAGRGALLFAVALVQAAIVAWLPRGNVGTLTETPWTALPSTAVLAYAAALGLVVARFLLHRQALAVGAAWALVASFLALDAFSTGEPARVHLAAAGLLFVVGATREPRHIVSTDPITRLPTRIEMQRLLRALKRRYAVAYVDIDDFPRFRHEHGPQAAQRILRAVARRLVRVGGSGRAFYSDAPTFVLVFPRTSAKAAARRVEAVRRAIEDITIDVSIPTASRGAPRTGRAAATVERTLSVTVSAGVAEAPRTGAEPRPVLDAAEQALVRARQAGMNCVSR